MFSRVLPWLLWPLVFVAYLAAMTLVAIYDAESVDRWLAVTTLVLILVLIGLEELLPYRRDWSIRGDKEKWRDIGHFLLYTNIGGTLAQIVFVAGSAALFARSGLNGGLGVWPTTARSSYSYSWSSRSATCWSTGPTVSCTTCDGCGRCMRFITRPSGSAR
jgi:hypothetical protein